MKLASSDSQHTNLESDVCFFLWQWKNWRKRKQEV